MTLLSPDNSRIWIQHLNTVLQNRKCGAAKATTTRTKKNCLESSHDATAYYCDTCKEVYQEEVDETELWIACDVCDK